jgi:hypothetical protein
MQWWLAPTGHDRPDPGRTVRPPSNPATAAPSRLCPARAAGLNEWETCAGLEITSTPELQALSLSRQTPPGHEARVE